jgi:DDE superfamily endonuclease
VIPPEQDAEFVAAMEDVLDVYERPADPKRPTVCVDELHTQLIDETCRPLAPARGRVERYDYEYVRRGSANIFCAFEPLSARRVTKVTDRRTRRDLAEFLRELVDEHYPAAERIVLVTDNLNTHTTASLYETFAPEEARRIARKLEWHDTPKHGSWLNMVEIELSVLSRQCLHRRIGDRATLEAEVARWTEARNASGARITWRFTTADARNKLSRLYPSIES